MPPIHKPMEIDLQRLDMLMTLDPIYTASLAIQLHVAAALPALVIGPVVVFRPNRDRIHKILGYVWIAAMLGLAVSGLFIESDIALVGHFGPIHLLSLFTLWGVVEGLGHAIRRNIPAHRATMQNLWFGAMGLAGLMTLLPGRRMNEVLFSGDEHLGWIAIAVGLMGLILLWRRTPRLQMRRS